MEKRQTERSDGDSASERLEQGKKGRTHVGIRAAEKQLVEVVSSIPGADNTIPIVQESSQRCRHQVTRARGSAFS